MFEAQYLRPTSGDVYSPWMERGGDNVIVTADVIDLSGSLTLTVQLYHKEHQAAGNGTLVTGGALSCTTTGRTSLEYSGLKDLVRYKFSATEEEESDDPALFRMLDPVWFDDVLA